MKKTILFAAILTGFFFSSCEKENYDSNGTQSNCTSVQCSSTASSTGSRCRNKTTNCNGMCHNHQPAKGSKF